MWYLFLRTEPVNAATGEYHVDIVGPFNSPLRAGEWLERMYINRYGSYRLLGIGRWDATVQNPETMERNHYIVS